MNGSANRATWFVCVSLLSAAGTFVPSVDAAEVNITVSISKVQVVDSPFPQSAPDVYPIVNIASLGDQNLESRKIRIARGDTANPALHAGPWTFSRAVDSEKFPNRIISLVIQLHDQDPGDDPTFDLTQVSGDSLTLQYDLVHRVIVSPADNPSSGSGEAGAKDKFVAKIWYSVSASFPADIKVMPLGDSNTVGCCRPQNLEAELNGGYRKALYNKLVENDYAVDFVGSFAAPREPANSTFDIDHQGAAGENVEGMLAFITQDNVLEKFKPDVILYHIGTNDLRSSSSDPGAVAERVKQTLD